MQVTLLRHTDVDEHYHRCYNGHIDIELSEAGKQEAKYLAEYFDTIDFDAVFCSDLQRAKQTLEYSKHYKNAVFTSELREKSWGKHEGLSFEEIVAQDEIKYIEFIQWVVALDGESYESFIERVRKFFLEYLPSLEKDNILVLTHAGVIRVLMFLVRKTSLEEAFCASIPCGSYVVYDSDLEEFSNIKCSNIAKIKP